MLLTITKKCVLASVLFALTSCGAFNDETKLEIQMYGVPKVPDGATGDRDPQFQTYEILSITLENSEGNVPLLSQPKSFKIVDRPQIILDRVVDDHIGKTFTQMTIVLSPKVVGGDNKAANLSFTLSNPLVSLSDPLTVEEGKDLTVRLKTNWANTITSETMTEPSFEISAQ